MSRRPFTARAVLGAAAIAVALLATGCSDATSPSTVRDSAGTLPRLPSTGDSLRILGEDNTAVASSTRPSANSVSASSTSTDALAYSQLSAVAQLGAAVAANPTYCLSNSPGYRLHVMTQSGIPFYPTGSGSAEQVYFRANFYVQAGSGSSPRFISSTPWFMTNVGPGQVSGQGWYYTRWGSWYSEQLIQAVYGQIYIATYEYYWYQDGGWVKHLVASPGYRASGSGFSATPGGCVPVQVPTSGGSGNATGGLLTGLVLGGIP